MVVIKHREKEPHNYYKISCDCGCIFAFDEIEFTNYKTIGVASTINCPDCGKEYVKGHNDIIQISKEGYQIYLDNEDE